MTSYYYYYYYTTTEPATTETLQQRYKRRRDKHYKKSDLLTKKPLIKPSKPIITTTSTTSTTTSTTTTVKPIITTNKPIITTNKPILSTKNNILPKINENTINKPQTTKIINKPVNTKVELPKLPTNDGSTNGGCDMTFPCTTECLSLWNINYEKQSWYAMSNDINDESIIIKLTELNELNCDNNGLYQTTGTLAPWRRLYTSNGGACRPTCKKLNEFVNETMTYDDKYYLTESMNNFCGTKQSMKVDLCVEPCLHDTTISPYHQKTTQKPFRRILGSSSSSESSSNNNNNNYNYNNDNRPNKNGKGQNYGHYYQQTSESSSNGNTNKNDDSSNNNGKQGNNNIKKDSSSSEVTGDIGYYYYQYYTCDKTKYEFSLIDFKDYPNVMTFKIGIDTWPFSQPSNKLELCLDIKTLTNSIQYNYDTWDPTNTCINCQSTVNDLSFVKTLNFGNWRIDSPLIFWCDDKPIHNIDVNYNIRNERKFEVCYTYGSCNGTLTYEGLVLYIDKNKDSSKQANVGFKFGNNGEILGINDKEIINKNEIIKERNILIPIILSLCSIFIIGVSLLMVLIFKKRKSDKIKKGYESATKVDDIENKKDIGTNGVDIEESVEISKDEDVGLNEGNTDQ